MSDNNNYHDNNFNLYQAYSYTLLLQIELASFSYAVVNQNRLLVSGQNCEIDELIHPKQLNDLLSATYKNIIIGLPATGLTLVPNPLFGASHVSGFARLLDVKENETVLAQTLDDQNKIIYKTPAALIAAVEKFDVKNTVYTAKGWIEAIAKSNKPDNNLYLEVGIDRVQILYFSFGTLRFYNTFEVKNDDELVYFTSLVADELKLNAHEITLILSGNITAGDKNMKRLIDFYPNVQFNTLHILELPSQLVSHKMLAIAALSLCGSSEAL